MGLSPRFRHYRPCGGNLAYARNSMDYPHKVGNDGRFVFVLFLILSPSKGEWGVGAIRFLHPAHPKLDLGSLARCRSLLGDPCLRRGEREERCGHYPFLILRLSKDHGLSRCDAQS